MPDALAAAIGGGATEGAAAPQRGQQGSQAVALGHLAQHLHNQILREGREQEAAAARTRRIGGGWRRWRRRRRVERPLRQLGEFALQRIVVLGLGVDRERALKRRLRLREAAELLVRRGEAVEALQEGGVELHAALGVGKRGLREAEAEVARRPVAQQRHEQLVPGLGRHRVCRDERFRVQADGERERAPLERRRSPSPSAHRRATAAPGAAQRRSAP